jgi:hypothetical protein
MWEDAVGLGTRLSDEERARNEMNGYVAQWGNRW